jgi:hypothetical protein
MNTYPCESKGRVISITSARLAGTPQSHSVIAPILGSRAMDLAELAGCLQADRNLCYLVTEAACQEFGWPWLSLEEAILLLGRQRLGALLSNPHQRGRSARQFSRALPRNHTAPAANPRRLETFQGQTK